MTVCMPCRGMERRVLCLCLLFCRPASCIAEKPPAVETSLIHHSSALTMLDTGGCSMRHPAVALLRHHGGQCHDAFTASQLKDYHQGLAARRRFLSPEKVLATDGYPFMYVQVNLAQLLLAIECTVHWRLECTGTVHSIHRIVKNFWRPIIHNIVETAKVGFYIYSLRSTNG